MEDYTTKISSLAAEMLADNGGDVQVHDARLPDGGAVWVVVQRRASVEQATIALSAVIKHGVREATGSAAAQLAALRLELTSARRENDQLLAKVTRLEKRISGDAAIDDLDLSVTATSALFAIGIKTIKDLRVMGEPELCSQLLKGRCSKKTIAEILETLPGLRALVMS